ncbi:MULTISPECIES: hypothetical protein [Pseudanabaena]|uniref:Uncharacterized protein n=2 Tax=Pseudanabaena TaxID=1152 RepID=L8N1B7_9CYAN|nr:MULTISPECIES: hypothetical protein [Pseudanabaena]ELS32053.1 hypothetical protein Pse7429DRAFT_1681 [Pseudanabaena biceps PCC 7429]MDG3495703.1 hypothetical protein [Pseudanabaena catenata USMAC16]
MTTLNNPATTSQPSLEIAPSSDLSPVNTAPRSFSQKIKGGIFLVVGYLLSPLCWWNDLIINLPIAYGFGYVVGLWQANCFFPAAIAGYWLSNLVGIVLMQIGAKDMLQNTVNKRSLKQEIFSGVITSTAYTVIIAALVYFHVLDLNAVLPIDQKFSLAFVNPQG